MADRRWVNPPRLRSVELETKERHSTWIELFFDLAFAVAVAQLSNLISHHPSATSFLHYLLLFAPVWFIWVGFTVYADRFDTDDVPHRLAVLAGMLVVAAVAVHIDDAFSGPFVCVRGTGKPWNPHVQRWADARLARFADDWRRWMRGELRIKDDTAVTAEDIESSHLVLFGDPALLPQRPPGF